MLAGHDALVSTPDDFPGRSKELLHCTKLLLQLSFGSCQGRDLRTDGLQLGCQILCTPP
jgi:hypothetical protein